jgi:TonB family protein
VRLIVIALSLIAAGAAFAQTPPSPPSGPASSSTLQPPVQPFPPVQRSGVTAPASIGTPHVCAETDYPVSALQTGTEGRTVLGFKITAEGTVADIAVVYSSGHDDLDKAAIACAATWVYRPATQNGTAVAAQWHAAVNWKIGSTPPFSQIAGAAKNCVIASDTGREELKNSKYHTVVKLHFAKGVITSIQVVGTSGDHDLDQRVAACFQQVSPELTSAVIGEQDNLAAIFASPLPPANASLATTPPAAVGAPHTCDETNYPVAALQTGAQGTATVAFKVTTEGAVKDVTVRNSSGSLDLDAASIACAKDWHYRPALKGNTPVEVVWFAQVKWVMQDTPDPSFLPLFNAAMVCVSAAAPLTADDLALAPYATVLRIRYVKSKIASVALTASSGNPELDRRIMECFEKMAPSYTLDVADGEELIPVAWPLMQPRQ